MCVNKFAWGQLIRSDWILNVWLSTSPVCYKFPHVLDERGLDQPTHLGQTIILHRGSEQPSQLQTDVQMERISSVCCNQLLLSLHSFGDPTCQTCGGRCWWDVVFCHFEMFGVCSGQVFQTEEENNRFSNHIATFHITQCHFYASNKNTALLAVTVSVSTNVPGIIVKG